MKILQLSNGRGGNMHVNRRVQDKPGKRDKERKWSAKHDTRQGNLRNEWTKNIVRLSYIIPYLEKKKRQINGDICHCGIQLTKVFRHPGHGNIKGELRSISTCSFFAQATLDLPVPKTGTHLVQPLQGSVNRELASTANSIGSELYTVF